MTHEAYHWDAEDYAAHSSAQFGWAMELAGRLRILGNERILDIGCGDGKVSLHLAAAVPRGQVIGIDSSPEMIGLAAGRYPSARFSNLSFVQMDARAISFCDPFDIAFSNSALHWVKEQDEVLKGVRENLKAGGRLLFQMGGKGNAGPLVPFLMEVMSQNEWRGYFRDLTLPYFFFGPEEYEEFLTQAGFQNIRVELLKKTMRQRGKSGLAGWIRTTWLPFTERVPEPLRDSFVAAIVDRFLGDYPPDEQGTVEVEMKRLEAEAVKP